MINTQINARNIGVVAVPASWKSTLESLNPTCAASIPLLPEDLAA
jgi:hypothetical protein